MPTLYDELTTGPLAAELAPYLAARNDAAIHEIMNRKDMDSYSWVSVAKFEAWCAVNTAEYVLIETHAANSASPLYSAAKAMLRRLSSNVDDNAFNLAEPAIWYLFDNWPFVDQTGATKASLLAAGIVKVSRAEQLGVVVTVNDVTNALNTGV